ncbi:HupE/UreJ family protein [Marinobacterium aestuariivivens]|uniref:HupE/UreJ family protein n=1 Tax=Marinobacterium aestuariivivens TaxID=1698799 RepID=A0ABW2A8R1_9GAMM
MQPLGTDHLLFLLGLMLVGGGPGRGGPTVIALLVGHSLTLWGTTLGYLHLALPPLEVVVALSVLFLGPEIVRRWHGQHDVTQHFPWIVSLLLGMLHGAGFASGYDGPAAAPADIPAGLLLFIAGVELTLLPAILLAVLLARGCRRLQRSGSWLIAVMPGYAVGSLGAYLTVKRALQLLAPMI